jgi:hypothetical protein
MKKGVCVLCGYVFYLLFLFLIPIFTICTDCATEKNQLLVKDITTKPGNNLTLDYSAYNQDSNPKVNCKNLRITENKIPNNTKTGKYNCTLSIDNLKKDFFITVK